MSLQERLEKIRKYSPKKKEKIIAKYPYLQKIREELKEQKLQTEENHNDFIENTEDYVKEV